MANVFEGDRTAGTGRFAIVVSRYNDSITRKLLEGALQTLAAAGVADDAVDVAWVPGAWEIPLVASRLAGSGAYSAVLCLGAVIRGETTHDQHINRQVSLSLGNIALNTGVPVLFGVLTCNTIEQAIHRSGGNVGNKGSECAEAALEMVHLLDKLPPQFQETQRPFEIAERQLAAAAGALGPQPLQDLNPVQPAPKPLEKAAPIDSAPSPLPPPPPPPQPKQPLPGGPEARLTLDGPTLSAQRKTAPRPATARPAVERSTRGTPGSGSQDPKRAARKTRRSRARQVVLQVIYEDDLNPQHSVAVSDRFLKRRLHHDPELVEFAQRMVAGVRRHRAEIDRVLALKLQNWSLKRLAATDRNVLRLGAYEILFGGTPGPVAINEAVELARRFGTQQSAHFVNGVLDRVFRGPDRR